MNQNTELYVLNIDIPQEWEDFADNYLYYILAYRRDQFDPITVDHIFDILYSRVVGRAISLSHSYWKRFRWSKNDALLDMMEHMWQIIHRRNIKGELGVTIIPDSFIKYFIISYKGHLLQEYKRQNFAKPVFIGSKAFINNEGDKEYYMIFGFNIEYTERIRQKNREYKQRAKQRAKERAKKDGNTRA